jgi:hypothetical protein
MERSAQDSSQPRSTIGATGDNHDEPPDRTHGGNSLSYGFFSCNTPPLCLTCVFRNQPNDAILLSYRSGVLVRSFAAVRHARMSGDAPDES